MIELVEFLRARLDEDEAAAQFVLSLQAREPDPEDWSYEYQWVQLSKFKGGGSGSQFFKGAPDPARVLREVEAKRRLMHGHSNGDFPYVGDEGGISDYSWQLTCRCGDEAPCPVLRLLGLPYADDPDYDPTWAPES